MEKRIRNLTERDMRFLKNLDGQLRSETLCYDSSARPPFQKWTDEQFSDRKISPREMLRILGISRKNDAVLYPSTTQFGFGTAFGLNHVDLVSYGVPPINSVLLRFKESQIPDGYDFQRLVPHFMEEMNLRTAKIAGIRITDNLVDYVY